jgi:hypothetical protein
VAFRFKKPQESGKKGRPLLPSHHIEDLESEFVATMYALREAEDQVISNANRLDSTQHANNHLVSFKKKISAIEVALRRLRHGY